MLINEKTKHIIVDPKWLSVVIQRIKSTPQQHTAPIERSNIKKAIKQLRKALDDDNIPVWHLYSLKQSLANLLNENMVFVRF
jgi:hypothetical protein